MTQTEKTGLTEPAPKPRPGHRALRIGSDGSCWIEGLRCEECGAVVAEVTIACRNCGSRNPRTQVRSDGSGILYSWSIIHRSYPGIAVPFISAIVDLDGGLALKGTLRDADIELLAPGLPVRVVFDDAGGAVDGKGAPYVGFHFVPEEYAHV